MKLFKILGVTLATALLLAGCSGGNTLSGSGGGGGTTGPTVASISLTTTSPNIPSDDSKSVTITALLRDANNVAVTGVTVAFSSGSTGGDGGVLTVTQAVSDSSGTATATLSAGSDPSDRVITVTAKAGTATPGTVPVSVTGTSLSLTGPNTLVFGGQGTYQVLLTNSSGLGVPNKSVTLTSANGNTIAPASASTDANGKASFTLSATSVANSGVDTVTANSLGLIQTHGLTVSSQSFTLTPLASANTTLTLGQSTTLTANWLSGGAPVVGSTVNFAATRGTLVNIVPTTDANGNATAQISSTTAGQAIISAQGLDALGNTIVSAQTSIQFVANVPTQLALQASPASVAVQTQSTLTATVRDAQNNLVQGATVNFSLTDTTGGTLSVASAVTDAQGRAQTTYTAGSTTSAANGVVVTASVPNTTPAVSGQATLTVGGQVVFLSLGTGNTIDTPNEATYAITYAVLAVDAHGAAVANVPITLSVLPLNYVKGRRNWNGTTWATVPSTLPSDPDAFPAGTQTCANEDKDYTGNIASLDVGALPMCTDLVTGAPITQHVKDYNCNGALDPGNVAVVSPSKGATDANGQLIVTITYPRDHAYYVTVQLVATASVQGTQSTTSSTFLLPGAAPDFNTQTVGPPGPVSPYGQANTCASPL